MERISWTINGLFKGNAEKCYAECESLDQATPENVLEYARDESTELHKCFEWNDTIAAEKYRLKQARQIIQSFVIVHEKKEEPKIRAYQITTQTNVYQPTRLFLQNKGEYSALLSRAKQELQAFKKRYSTLCELESVFEEIDKL